MRNKSLKNEKAIKIKNQLGMSHGKANNILKKSLLFYFVQKEKLDICFKCGKIIDNIEDFSIEHKKPWLDGDNPIELFFSLDNISFSHFKCNVSSGRRNKRINKKIGETGFKGVTLTKRNLKKPYMAKIKENGKDIYLGRYETPEEASYAYQEAFKK